MEKDIKMCGPAIESTYHAIAVPLRTHNSGSPEINS